MSILNSAEVQFHQVENDLPATGRREVENVENTARALTSLVAELTREGRNLVWPPIEAINGYVFASVPDQPTPPLEY